MMIKVVEKIKSPITNNPILPPCFFESTKSNAYRREINSAKCAKKSTLKDLLVCYRMKGSKMISPVLAAANRIMIIHRLIVASLSFFSNKMAIFFGIYASIIINLADNIN